MGRGINALTKAELQKDSFRLASLVQMDFSSPVKITDYGATITHGTLGTFLPSSHIIKVGESPESSSLRVNSLDIELSSVEQTLANLFLYDDYMGVRVRVWRTTIDAANNIIGEPWLFYEGRLTAYTIDDTDTDSVLSVEVSSHWKDFEKVNSRRTNSQSQARYFPDDTGFFFSPVSTTQIKWGKA